MSAIDTPGPGASGALAGRLLSLRRYSGIVTLVILWQLATMWAGSFFFPTPLTILQTAGELWFSGDPSHFFLTDAVFRDVLPSLGRLLAGWAIAVVLGVALGLAIGGFRRLAEAAQPVLEFLRALPSPALIPVFLILLGTDSTMRITLIVMGSLWPVLLNSIEGIRTLDQGQTDMARVFRLPPHARLFRIVLPAAMPHIFAGMRVSLAIAIILMVVSELVASSSGIGHAIIDAQNTFQLAAMWANVLLLALLGISLNGLFSLVENHVLYWHRAARRLAK
ncbi:ABC transporter permease [Amorphus sp. 3PC139-8]|uniref:ABC transporter permease n=1 Tax=Amorphus sp. 3PC139-8 TaxID=2735676 RepID=UPI00345DC642